MSHRPETHTLVSHVLAILLGKIRGEIIMNITGFVDHLKRRKGDRFKTDRDIANYLGTKPAQMSKWLKEGKSLTNLEMERLIERTRKAAIDETLSVAISPIVEFFPIEPVESKQGMEWELFATGKDAPLPARGLRMKLEKAKGIYIFHDTRGRALYAGKTTKRTLWAEMKNAFNRDRGRQELFRVEHPTRNQEFVSAADKLRSIKQTSVLLADMAAYFSAYEISPSMIDSIEALVIRAFANDLLNARMEKF